MGDRPLSELDLHSPAAVIDTLTRAAAALHDHPLRRGSHVMLPAAGSILIAGDLHDNPVHFQTILKLARLQSGDERHLLVQELIHSERLINGVDLSHRMLVRVAELVVQFPLQVHPILANHELAQMTGKGVSKGAGNSVELFLDGLDFVFGEAWEDVAAAIDLFIKAMPLAVRSEGGLFCAHSIPSPRLMDRFDPAILARAIEPEDYATNEGSAYLLVWGRGQSEEQLHALTAAWNVTLFVLGHEHVEAGCEMRGPHLVRINSDHECGSVLHVDLASIPTAEEAMMSALRLSAF